MARKSTRPTLIRVPPKPTNDQLAAGLRATAKLIGQGAITQMEAAYYAMVAARPRDLEK
jgi:hypothetical protein